MAIDDVRDFLTALSAARVDSVIVGAHALAVHGLVRATGDLDVLVDATPTNVERLERAVRVFADASLEYFGVSVEALSQRRLGFYMGVEPDRIDVLTRIAGVGFERARRGSLAACIEGVEVRVLGLAELIAAKRASARRRPAGSAKALQDQADLAWLVEARGRRRAK